MCGIQNVMLPPLLLEQQCKLIDKLGVMQPKQALRPVVVELVVGVGDEAGVGVIPSQDR